MLATPTVEPIPLDQFAGKTVKTVEMALEIIGQREKHAPRVR